MKAQNMINMVKRFTEQYGVNVTYQEFGNETNSRGRPINIENGIIKNAKVLLLKEKFNPLQVTESNIIGLTQDYTRYVITLPEINLKKDMVITDNHNMKWKLGVVDWFDVGGESVCKQAALTEVQ